MNQILNRPLFFKNGGSTEVNFGNTGGVNFGSGDGVNFGSGNIPTTGSLFSKIQNSGLFDSSTAANNANNTGYEDNADQNNTSTNSGSAYGGYVPDQRLLNQASSLYTPRWLAQLQTGVPNVSVDGKQLDITPIKDDTGFTIGYNDGSGVDRVIGSGLPNTVESLASTRGFKDPQDMFQNNVNRGIVSSSGFITVGPLMGARAHTGQPETGGPYGGAYNPIETQDPNRPAFNAWQTYQRTGVHPTLKGDELYEWVDNGEQALYGEDRYSPVKTSMHTVRHPSRAAQKLKTDAEAEGAALLSRNNGGPINKYANGGEIMQDPNMMGGSPQGLDALVGQVNPQMLQGPEMEDPQMLAGAEQQAATEAEGIGRGYLNSVMTDLDSAEDAESVINALRGDQMPISARYEELAGIVGLQDAQATPESVLALVQPSIMLSQDEGPVDSGVGRLMQGVAGDVNMATGEGDVNPMGQGVGNLMMQGAAPQESFA